MLPTKPRYKPEMTTLLYQLLPFRGIFIYKVIIHPLKVLVNDFLETGETSAVSRLKDTFDG